MTEVTSEKGDVLYSLVSLTCTEINGIGAIILESLGSMKRRTTTSQVSISERTTPHDAQACNHVDVRWIYVRVDTSFYT